MCATSPVGTSNALGDIDGETVMLEAGEVDGGVERVMVG